MSLLDAIAKPVNDVYYDLDFLQCVETYLPNLKTDPQNRVLTVEPTIAYKYEGDFYGLMVNQGVPLELIPICLRLNDYRAYSDYDGKQVTFILPSLSSINAIVNRYKTIHTVV